MYVAIYVSINLCIYVSMYLCMYVCMYVYVSMYVMFMSVCNVCMCCTPIVDGVIVWVLFTPNFW